MGGLACRRGGAGATIQGGRIGGKVYITARIDPKGAKGTPWKLASVGSAWELVTVAPRPDRLATVLTDALKQQGKNIWQTNLPKEVKLVIEEDKVGPNPAHEASISFDDDPDDFLDRDYFRVSEPEARQIWATRAIRDAVLAVDKLQGADK